MADIVYSLKLKTGDAKTHDLVRSYLEEKALGGVEKVGKGSKNYYLNKEKDEVVQTSKKGNFVELSNRVNTTVLEEINCLIEGNGFERNKYVR